MWKIDIPKSKATLPLTWQAAVHTRWHWIWVPCASLHADESGKKSSSPEETERRYSESWTIILLTSWKSRESQGSDWEEGSGGRPHGNAVDVYVDPGAPRPPPLISLSSARGDLRLISRMFLTQPSRKSSRGGSSHREGQHDVDRLELVPVGVVVYTDAEIKAS